MAAPSSLAELLAPIGEAEFFTRYHDQRPLHVPAAASRRYADLMSWRLLSDLLNMTAIWSDVSLGLVLDKAPVPPAHYCRQAADRNMQTRWQPDAALVKSFLRRGASLVANDIDTLAPGLAQVANLLEASLGGKTQSNLYCSWRQHQAFAAHFDTHDVFALHFEGEKRWRIYERRVDRPIAHPMFKNVPQEAHERAKGELLLEPTLKPGDLLYIPRGYYHEALASSAGTVHVAFGVTYPIGLDLLDILHGLALEEPLFRGNLPAADAESLAAHLAALGARLLALSQSERVRQNLARFRAGFRYPRGGFDLPGDSRPEAYTVHRRGVSVVERNGQDVLQGPSGATPIPVGHGPQVRWVLTRERFAVSEFSAAFPNLGDDVNESFLTALATMKVIGPA